MKIVWCSVLAAVLVLVEVDGYSLPPSRSALLLIPEDQLDANLQDDVTRTRRSPEGDGNLDVFARAKGDSKDLGVVFSKKLWESRGTSLNWETKATKQWNSGYPDQFNLNSGFVIKF